MLRRNLLIAGILIVLSSIAMTASAQPGGFFGGMPGGGLSFMLLRMPEVQKELNLNAGQKTRITTLLGEVNEKLRPTAGQVNFQELRNLSAEEREKRTAQMRKRFEEATKGIDDKLGDILDANQAERLKQLKLQREGAMALNRPEVIQKLGLSEDQQKKIKKIQEDTRTAGRPAFDANQSAEARQAAMQKVQEQREKAQRDCFAVLSDDQTLDWYKLCGKTFKFRERQPFGRGNRPGPPPPQR